MSANVESAAYANEPAWHREGVVLDTEGNLGMTVGQALKASDLDWTVQKVPIFAYDQYTRNEETGLLEPNQGKPGDNPTFPDEIESQYGVQRSSDKKILGVVGDVWQPVQNQEGFDVLQDLLSGDDLWIEAAGSLDGGKKVWVLAHLAKDQFIAGEQISRYLLFSNGHDGRSSVSVLCTDVRVVCQNTLTFAKLTAKRQLNLRHTIKATERLKQAKTIMGLRDKYSEELAKEGEFLAKTKISDKAFNKFLEELFPIKEDQDERPSGTMARKRRDEVRRIYKEADNLNDIRGTKWGALNAVVEYADYRRGFSNDNTQVKAQFSKADIKDHAFALLA